MNILHISEYYPPYIKGGGEISASIILNELSKKHRIVVACSVKAKNKKIESNENIKIYAVLKSYIPDIRNFIDIVNYLLLTPYIYPFYNIITINKILEINKIDLIQIEYNSFLHFPLVLFLFIRRKKIILSLRDGSLLCPNSFVKGTCQNENLKRHKCYKELITATELWRPYFELFRPIYAILRYLHHKIFRYFIKLLINRSRDIVVITISEYLKRAVINYGIDKDKVNVNYIPIAPNEFIPKKKVPGRFVFAGRLEVEKGIWVLIKAFELLQYKFPKTELLIIGDGYLINFIKRYLAEHNLNRIKLIGKLSYKEVLEYYSSAIAIVAPSNWPEPFGRFILDSIVTKTPLITANHGGPSDIIVHEFNGLLFKKGDVKALEKEMSRVLIDERLGKKISRNIIAKEEFYNKEFLANQRLLFFNKLLLN